jgi:hypothetical protein
MSFSKEPANAGDDRPENRRLSTDMIAGTAAREPEPDRIDEKTADERRTPDIDRSGDKKHLEPLFDNHLDGEFRNRWREIQAGFVDEPRNAVQRADQLVAELMQTLAQSFSKQRNELEHQWDASENVSTEDLRVALTRYRSFFERLLSV